MNTGDTSKRLPPPGGPSPYRPPPSSYKDLIRDVHHQRTLKVYDMANPFIKEYFLEVERKPNEFEFKRKVQDLQKELENVEARIDLKYQTIFSLHEQRKNANDKNEIREKTTKVANQWSELETYRIERRKIQKEILQILGKDPTMRRRLNQELANAYESMSQPKGKPKNSIKMMKRALYNRVKHHKLGRFMPLTWSKTTASSVRVMKNLALTAYYADLKEFTYEDQTVDLKDFTKKVQKIALSKGIPLSIPDPLLN